MADITEPEDPKQRVRVLVIYKSGNEVLIECDAFKVNKNAMGALVSVEWKKASPSPMVFGIDDVTAIYELDPL